MERLLNLGSGAGWAICGVGTLPAERAMQQVLDAQDCLYSLVLKGTEDVLAPQVIGSIARYLYAPVLTGSRSSSCPSCAINSQPARTFPFPLPPWLRGRDISTASTSRVTRSTSSTGAARNSPPWSRSSVVIRRRCWQPHDVFGELAVQPQFVAAYREAVVSLYERGARATVTALLG